MTRPARLLRSPAVPDSTLAVVILCLAFLAAVVAALLLALSLEARGRLARIEASQRKHARDVKERLASDRACMLRDMTHGRKDDETS